MTHYADDTEILTKLGILNSKLECPNRMKNARRVRAALNMPPASTSSLSDDSDDEIVFDRNALLNARKRRRQRRSFTRITNLPTDESTKWRLFCLCCTFFCIGLATVIVGLTKPDIMSNVRSTQLTDYAHIFVYMGVGYFIGTWIFSLIFTRLNAYLCLVLLLGISIPFSVLIVYQTKISHINMFLLFQGILFGAIERGTHLMIFGIWKGDKRVLFMFYMSLAIGGAVSSLLSTEEVFARTSVIGKTHSIKKREIANAEVPSFAPLSSKVENSTNAPKPVTRPSSAIGIVDVVDTKTKENEERRKQALAAKTEAPSVKCANETECFTNESVSTTTKQPTTTQSTTQSTTTLTSTTQSTTTTTQTTRATSSPKNKARNRVTETLRPSSIVDQVKQNVADHVKDISQFDNSSQLAYLLILAFMLMTMVQLILGFCACCINSNLIADPRIAQLEFNSTTSQAIPMFIQLVSFACWYLQSLPESISLMFLPHFILNSRTPDVNTQNGSAFFCGVFWSSIAVFRMFVAIRPSLSVSAKLMKSCYILGIFISFLLHNISTESELTLFVGLLAIGFLLISMPLTTYTWLQQKLNYSPYILSRRYFAALSLSKITAPLIVVWMLNDEQSTRGALSLITWISFFGFISFFLLLRSVNPLARHWQIHELSGDINGRRSTSHTPRKAPRARKGAYQALMDEAENNQSDADVEMDIVQAERGILSDSSNSI
ncbi:Sodium-dependent glucose transporter 1 [Aphelenchoides besseyi]|nr:Sodium-dependent glucose transporter 1 [Aphelenchoides besseyi]KAI6212139.1 Sodium-dependent glucose transporter 1 [Aphelenchoides besseyi]